MVTLPGWANQHFWVEENGDLGLSIACSPEERKFFQDEKDELKELCSFSEWDYIPKEHIKVLVQSYILCNLGLGLIDRQRAVAKKEEGGNGRDANDGLGRQHWIPECYMKSFSEDGLTHKVDRSYIASFSDDDVLKLKQGKKLGKLVSLKSKEFCETEKEKGAMYDPYFEIFLSKVEGDYAVVSKGSSHTDTLWDFIVLASFFWVLRCRTKEMKDASHLAWKNKHGLLFDTIPEIIAGAEIVRFNPEKLLALPSSHSLYGKFALPFTQHPVYNMREGFNASLWAIYTPGCLLWFRNKESKHKAKHAKRLIPSVLSHMLGDKTTRNLYFRPSDMPWSVHSLD